jgi:hypothetical protein
MVIVAAAAGLILLVSGLGYLRTFSTLRREVFEFAVEEVRVWQEF